MSSVSVKADEPQSLLRSAPILPSSGQTTKSIHAINPAHEFLAKYPLGQPLLKLDGADLRYLFHAAGEWLTAQHEEVNRLNVFPVPDGDTGTNLVLTLNAAWSAARIGADDSVDGVSKAAAAGALQGSRGISGLIFAQLLRGFSQALTAKAYLLAQDLVTAFARATEVAYQSVPAPIEGTILTVLREMSLATNLIVQTTHDLRAIFAHLVAAADQAVRQTPELLPTLKKAGVVDAGGKGLFYILEGMRQALLGQQAATETPGETSTLPVPAPASTPKGERTLPTAQWGFEVQCLIEQPKESVEMIRQTLLVMGDAVLVEGDARLVKLHVHVRDPGEPLSYAVRLGFVTEIGVENLDDQAARHLAAPLAASPPSVIVAREEAASVEPIALVAVVPGPGFAEILRNLGVSALVEGGPGVNPNPAQLATTIQNLPHTRVLLLPNHSSLLATAHQAVQLVAEADETRQVVVLPTKSVPQGIAAALALNPLAPALTALAEELHVALERVDTGEVTQAVHADEFDGLTVEVGDCIGLHEGRLVTRGANPLEVVLALLIQMAADESELITLYYGADIAQDAAQNLAEIVRTHYPEQQVKLAYGGQPHYDYVLSTE